MRRFFLVLSATVLLSVPVFSGSNGNTETPIKQPTWPQWRGPNRDGQIGGTKWPERLSKDSLELLWRVPLGPSYSGAIVAEDRVFTTETKNKESESVYALDRKNGQERWRAEWKGAMTVPFFAASNGSWIRSTPAYDGERLYVAGMRDVLVCFDGRSGKELWRVGGRSRTRAA